MENFISIINPYIETRFGNYDKYTYLLERLNGLSNEIYLLKILEKYSEVTKEICVFRKFGPLSDMVNRKLESKIIDLLSMKGLTPKIIASDKQLYRFEEFIEDGDVIDKYTARSQYFIDRLSNLLVFYSTLSVIYNYNIITSFDECEKSWPIIEYIPSKNYTEVFSGLEIDNNIFDSCIKLISKVKENFLIFSDKFLKVYFSQNNYLENDPHIYSQFEKFSYYVKNIENIFLRIFPSKGLFVLNHNDVHKLNLLSSEGKDKIYILDHEYAGLNLIGMDIVNFLIETNYDYTIKVFPYYEYTPELIDLEAYYKIFLKFIDEFINRHKEISTRVVEEIEENLEEIRSFKYFLGLTRIINLFWILVCFIKLDFDNFESHKKFDYFKHTMDRINLFELADGIIDNINNSNNE